MAEQSSAADVYCDACRKSLKWVDVYLYNAETGSLDMKLCEACWGASVDIGAAQEHKAKQAERGK